MEKENKQLNSETKSDLVSLVLERLDSEAIQPRSKLYWLSQEGALWSLWGLSVLLGALSVAVVTFASLNASYALYEATHESFATFLIEVLPYIWFVLFALMAISSYFNLRHTKRGYKYPWSLVVGSGLFFSLFGGMVLNAFGAGFYIDTFLGKTSPYYQSQKELEVISWQKPEEGRFFGVIESLTGSTTDLIESTLVLKDFENNVWKINTEELREHDRGLLEEGAEVRLIGVANEDGSVDACAVVPRIGERPPLLRELKEERREFEDQMKYQGEKSYSDSEIFDEDDDHELDVKCAELLPVKRFAPPVTPKLDDDEREGRKEVEMREEREMEEEDD